MGVYRSLLEEEIEVAGVLDDDNNVDLKEIEDIVNDQDANKAEQDRAQEAEFADPGTSVDDIMDESAMAIYEFENTHAKIMQAVGMFELTEAAAGREFIFEAADVKKFFDKIKDAIKDFFKKCWQVLQRWAGNIAAAFSSNKKLLDKYSSKIDAGYEKLKNSKEEPPEMFSFDRVGDDKGASAKIQATSIFNAYADIKKVVTLTNISDLESIDADLSSERLNGAADDLRKSVCGFNNTGESVSAGELSEKIKAVFMGQKTKDWMTPEKVKEGLGDTKQMKKGPNEMMKKVRDLFKQDLQAIESLEKQAKKLDESKEREKYLAICTRISTFIRSCRSTAQTVSNAYCYSINKFAHQSRTFALKYISASNKSDYKGFQKESTEYGFLGKFF